MTQEFHSYTQTQRAGDGHWPEDTDARVAALRTRPAGQAARAPVLWDTGAPNPWRVRSETPQCIPETVVLTLYTKGIQKPGIYL